MDDKTLKLAAVLLLPLPALYFPLSSIATHTALSIEHTEINSIIHKNRGDHGTCKYTYEVKGINYTGTGMQCGHVPVGYYMRIFYNPTLPQISSNELPSTNILSNLFSTILIMALSLLAFFIILGQKEEKV